MSPHALWNRRQLLQGAASLTALHAMPGLASSPLPRYAYAGSTEGGGNIHVFSIGGPRWKPLQTIPSQRPVSLALHPSGKLLYAVNEIAACDGLPRGSVESFAIDPRTGRLTRLNRQPLSLSGILPRHLTLSPDGQHIVVAIYGGGAWNVLPIASDGSLQPVSSIVKHAGAGPHPQHQQAAHPHTALFDPTGRYLLASDLGADRLSLYTLHEGRLSLLSRTSVTPGSGPGQMAFHPSGQLLVVANQLQSTVSTFAFRPASSDPLVLRHTAPLVEETHSTLHLCGDLLHTAAAGSSTTLTAWSVDPTTGVLSPIDQVEVPQATLHLTQAPLADRSLYLLDEKEGGILHLPKAPRLGSPSRLATVPQPRSLVFL